MRKDIQNILHDFKSISLEEIQGIKLMNRIDRKYLLSENQLMYFWEHLIASYDVFQINGARMLKYKTVYYDTQDDDMYKAHHNGKLNRLKIRHRTYVNSNEGYLELKQKTNKGRTVKKRVPSDPFSMDLTGKDQAYVKKFAPFAPEDLEAKLVNHFSRVTLVNKALTERCTIDFEITFDGEQHSQRIDNAVVIEIKSDKGNSDSMLAKYLQQAGIKETAFSKYCTGRILLDPALKYNRFKSRLRMMERILQQAV